MKQSSNLETGQASRRFSDLVNLEPEKLYKIVEELGFVTEYANERGTTEGIKRLCKENPGVLVTFLVLLGTMAYLNLNAKVALKKQRRTIYVLLGCVILLMATVWFCVGASTW